MFTKGYKIGLKALRINSDFTVAEIAKLLKVSETAVESWENGNASPTLLQADKLALIYNVDLRDLNHRNFRTAKEIYFNNVKMAKEAKAAGCDGLNIDPDGFITGYYKT